MHGYAHALPDGRAVDLLVTKLGPWLKPSFDIKGWAFPEARAAVAQIIDLYNDLLDHLAGDLPNFTHVDLRGVVNDGDWVNELHLSNDGFKLSPPGRSIRRSRRPSRTGSRGARLAASPGPSAAPACGQDDQHERGAERPAQ